MELTNKALALILIVATSVSLIGTILTVNNLEKVRPAYIFTARATQDSATANFSINSSIDIVFIVDLVEFGTGLVNSSDDHNCTLNTSQATFVATDCLGFNPPPIAPLRIRNQGTQNVTLNLSFNATPTTFVGGTTPNFTFRMSENETGACNSPGQLLYTSWTEVAEQNFTVCNSSSFNWINNARTLNIDLAVRIPQNAPAGRREVLVSAYAIG